MPLPGSTPQPCWAAGATGRGLRALPPGPHWFSGHTGPAVRCWGACQRVLPTPWPQAYSGEPRTPPALPNAGSHTQNPEKGTVSLGLEDPKSTRPCDEGLARHRLSGTLAWAPTVASTTPGTLSDAAGGPPAVEARPPEDSDSPDRQHGQLCGLGSYGATWTRGFPAPSEGLHSARIPETGYFLSAFRSCFLSCAEREVSRKPGEKSAPCWLHRARGAHGDPRRRLRQIRRYPAAESACSDSWGARSSSPPRSPDCSQD